MKQNKEPMGPDYFRLYLNGHLRDHWFPQYTDKRFIEERTEAAYDKFTEMRKEGHDVTIAQEMAMRVLLEGIYVSRYDIIYNVVEELSLAQMHPAFSCHAGNTCRPRPLSGER